MSQIIINVPDSYTDVGLLIEAWSCKGSGFFYLDKDYRLSDGCCVSVDVVDEIDLNGSKDYVVREDVVDEIPRLLIGD